MEDIKVEAISSTQCKVNIEIPALIVDKKFDEFFASIKDEAEAPGFRRGHVPVNILKQRYSIKARPTVVQSLFVEYFEQAIKDGQINPIGTPEIKDFDKNKSEYPGKFGFDGTYSVEFVVDTLPKIDAVGYAGLEIETPVIDEAALFANRMNEYREQFAERKQVADRGAMLGDSLVIDFTGYVDGVAFDGGAAKGFTMNKLGSSGFIPGFEGQLVGIKSDETKKISVKFPDDYQVSHLKGKEATFDITAHNIIEVKPADIDSDLALMAGFTTLEEMSNNTKQRTEEDRKALLRQQMDGAITTKLLEINKFDAPKSMINGELNSLLARFQNRENMPTQFMDQLKQRAETNVKRALIYDAIYEKEQSVEITPDELSAALDEQAKLTNKTKDELISALYNSKQMDNFVGMLRTAKVVDFIINNLKKGN